MNDWNLYNKKYEVVNEMLTSLKWYWDLADELFKELVANKLNEAQLDVIIEYVNKAADEVRMENEINHIWNSVAFANELRQREAQERILEKENMNTGADFSAIG